MKMKRIPLFIVLIACLLLCACTILPLRATHLPATASSDKAAAPLDTPTALPASSDPTLLADQSTAANSPTPDPETTKAAPTAAPFVLPEAWQGIRSRLEAYGRIDESLISREYIERVQELIRKYGKAEYISALEYHGDSYDMLQNAYSMDPATFKAQIETLMRQEYHFVTLAELEAFVYGDLDLPDRSIILTSDLSADHIASMPSITATFKDLENEFGYKPHMQVFVWAGDMQSDLNPNCENDACWDLIRDAIESGYFSIGSHSWSHSDASKWHINITKEDFKKANTAILENTGLTAFAVAWPFESAYEYTDRLSESGFTLAFGGLTRATGPQLVQSNDPTPMRLPRLLPPAISGTSMRPKGSTLQQILDTQTMLNAQLAENEPDQTPAVPQTENPDRAQRILVLEYHGISYDMYAGAYALDPQTFSAELDLLCQQGYRFLNLSEMQSFVDGSGSYQKKSILLTSDLTLKSVGQLPEILRRFKTAQEKWGCQPHMALFVVTDDMASQPDTVCKDNACWALLKDAAAEPEFFSLGVHSASNLPFGQASPAWHLEDMARAQTVMEEQLGYRPFALSWPYEICPVDMTPYKALGFTIGFGGVSKALKENYPVPGDEAPLCLPRMLPPNLEGRSIRPAGLSLEEMLEAALQAH